MGDPPNLTKASLDEMHAPMQELDVDPDAPLKEVEVPEGGEEEGAEEEGDNKDDGLEDKEGEEESGDVDEKKDLPNLTESFPDKKQAAIKICPCPENETRISDEAEPEEE